MPPIMLLLDCLRNLNYEELSECQLISKKLKRIVEYYPQELPRFVVTSAITEQMIVSDNVRSSFISEFGKRFNREERKQWMAANGYTLDVYEDLSGLRIGSDQHNFWMPLQYQLTDFINLRIRAPYKDSPCPMSLMFCSDLRRDLSTEYWAAALHFFRLVRHPSAFFRQIMLFPFDFKLWEAAKWEINGPVFCHIFALSGMPFTSQLTTWLMDNIRADHLEIYGGERDIGALSAFMIRGKRCARSRFEISWMESEQILEFIEKFATEFGDARNMAGVVNEFFLISDHYCITFRKFLMEQFEEYLEPETNPPVIWFTNKYNVKSRMRVTLNFFNVHFELVLDTTNAK